VLISYHLSPVPFLNLGERVWAAAFLLAFCTGAGSISLVVGDKLIDRAVTVLCYVLIMGLALAMFGFVTGCLNGDCL
jgi:hypothetical protein